MEKQRDDRRLPQVGPVHVATPEFHPRLHARRPGAPLRTRHERRIDFDADAARTELLRGGDGNPSITGTQIEDNVVRAHPAKLQHLADD